MSPPSKASRSVIETSRSMSAPRRRRPVLVLPDDDVEITATRRLAGQPDAGAGICALGDRDFEALALDLYQPGRAVVGLVEGDLSDGLGGRPGLCRSRSGTTRAAVAHPAEGPAPAPFASRP